MIYSETSRSALCLSFQVLLSFSFSLDNLQRQREEGKQEGKCEVRALGNWDVSKEQKRNLSGYVIPQDARPNLSPSCPPKTELDPTWLSEEKITSS